MASNDINSMVPDKKMEYLDTDVSNLSTLTKQQKDIIIKAQTRLYPYVVYKQKAYKLNVSFGSQLQMSERLFELLKAQIKQTNALIKDLNVISDPKDSRILYVKKTLSNTNIRLKDSTAEGAPIGNADQFIFIPWGADIYVSNSTLKQAARGTGLLSVIAVMFPDPTVSKFVAVAAGITAIKCQSYSDDSLNGIIIHITGLLLEYTIYDQPVGASGTW